MAPKFVLNIKEVTPEEKAEMQRIHDATAQATALRNFFNSQPKGESFKKLTETVDAHETALNGPQGKFSVLQQDVEENQQNFLETAQGLEDAQNKAKQDIAIEGVRVDAIYKASAAGVAPVDPALTPTVPSADSRPICQVPGDENTKGQKDRDYNPLLGKCIIPTGSYVLVDSDKYDANPKSASYMKLVDICTPGSTVDSYGNDFIVSKADTYVATGITEYTNNGRTIVVPVGVCIADEVD